MPPIPVTFFMADCVLVGFDIIVLAAKPEQNEMAITSRRIVVFVMSVMLVFGGIVECAIRRKLNLRKIRQAL